MSSLDLSEELFHAIYKGICVNTNDPEGFGRIQATCPQVFGNHTTLTGWAWPCVQPPGTNIVVPVPNQGVWIQFEGGDPAYPIWCGVWGAPPS